MLINLQRILLRCDFSFFSYSDSFPVVLLCIFLSLPSTISDDSLPTLVDYENPPSAPLDICQGDCDNDDECEGDLICFFNDGNDDNVPWGCEGTATASWDYCFEFPRIETNDGYVLIQRHKSVYDGLFKDTVLDTGMENINNPDNNTYSIIGYVNPDDYLFEEDVYWFRLEYGYSDGSNVTLEWTQESWLTESTVEGADLSNIPDETTTSGALFYGLALSSSGSSYLDGEGSTHSNWWNAVAVVTKHGGGIPAFNEEVAVSSRLFVRIPGNHLHWLLSFSRNWDI